MPSRPLLLDTCAAIWVAEAAPMTQASIDALSDATYAKEPIAVSPITAWERGLLVSLGRLGSTLEPKAWFNRLVEREEMVLAQMTPDILTDASFLPGPIHRDPADRIIIATARAFGMTIVTRDRLILDYAARGHVNALEC